MAMRISVADARDQLDELVQRADAGDDIILTRPDQRAMRLVPVGAAVDKASRLAVIAAVRASAAEKVRPGPDAARSQDFLYDEDGLPR